MSQMTVNQWVVGLLLTTTYINTSYFYLKISRKPFSKTIELLVGSYCFIMGFTFATIDIVLLNDNWIVPEVLSYILIIIGFYFYYVFHDQNDYINIKGYFRLVFTLFTFGTIGYLFQFILGIDDFGMYSNRFVVINAIIIASITFLTIFIRLYKISKELKVYPDPSQLSITLPSLLLSVIFVLFVIYVIYNFSLIIGNSYFGFIFGMITINLLLLIYSLNPFKILFLPRGLLWLGILTDEGKIFFSHKFTKQSNTGFAQDEFENNLEKIFRPFNNLLSEAFNVNLEINEVIAEDFILITKSILGGHLISIFNKVDKYSKIDRNHEIINKLVTDDKSPFVSINKVGNNLSTAHSYLENLMLEGTI